MVISVSNDVLEKYKNIIKNEFLPKRGFGQGKLSVARKAVNDFKKVSDHSISIADIMLYYVEIGVEFTLTYGDINEQFYSSMENMYSDALAYIFRNHLQDQFKDRCLRIVIDTKGMGWGFHDTLSDTFYEYYNR